MAMTTCKECCGLISTSAIACATCGVKTKAPNPHPTAIRLLFMVIIALVALTVVGLALSRGTAGTAG